jgi:ribonuclease D
MDDEAPSRIGAEKIERQVRQRQWRGRAVFCGLALAVALCSADLARPLTGNGMDYEYIETPERLRAAVERFRRLPLLGVDTEAAGYHRYFDRISLIQISSREENVLIDPLVLDDLSPLRDVLADPGVETVFHDADYDLRILDRDLGFHVRGLFDTQIAAAFVGERSLGLGAVIETFLGIKLPKAYQRADWAERPLNEGMKDYAATDTAHLPALRDRLRDELEARGRLEWAEEEFRRREQETRWTESDDPREAFMRVKGARDLPPRGLAILRELYEWRESTARARDQASFRVLGNQPMLELSARPPRNLHALGSVSGVGDTLVRRYGNEVLAAVRRGLEVAESELPRFPAPRRWERDPQLEARIERLKSVRNQRAEALSLDPGFLMSRSVLEEIARRQPDSPEALFEIPEVRRWQVEAVGDALLASLSP